MSSKPYRSFMTNKQLIVSSLRNKSLRSNKSVQLKNSSLGLIPEKKYKKSVHKSILTRNQSYTSNLHDNNARCNQQRQSEQKSHKKTHNRQNIQTWQSMNSLEKNTNYQPSHSGNIKVQSNCMQRMYTYQEIISIARCFPDYGTNAQLLIHFEDNLKKMLGNSDMFATKFQDRSIEPCVYNASKVEGQLMRKIEQLYKQKNRLKKQKKMLIQKIKQSASENDHLLANKSGCCSPDIKFNEKIGRQQQKLQKMIIEQSEIINRHNNDSQYKMQDLRKILVTQAKGLELSFKKMR